MEKPHFDVLVIGTPCVDIVFGGMPHWPALGKEIYVDDFAVSVGAVFNTAATLRRLGLRVALLCELGNDFFSRYILEEIDRAGIARDLVIVRDRPLFSISICLSHESERGFVSYTNMAGGVIATLVKRLSSGGSGEEEFLTREPHQLLDHCDFDAAFTYAHPSLLPLADAVVERGAKLFLDTGWNPDELRDPLMREVIGRGDFILPNQLEATFMTETETPEEAARVLSSWGPTAVVKLGARGAVACRGGELLACPAYPVERVVDTTGAGDAFNAGLMMGILKNYALLDAMRCGAICGSLSTTALTGTAAVPTYAELDRIRANLQT